MLYLVAYDVSNDPVRLSLSHILLRFGERVQESVYECRITRTQLSALLAECQPELAQDQKAHLRVYPVCQTCERRAIGLGAVRHARLEAPAIVF